MVVPVNRDMDKGSTETFADYVNETLAEMRLMGQLGNSMGGGQSSGGNTVGKKAPVSGAPGEDEGDAEAEELGAETGLGALLDKSDLGDPDVAKAFGDGDKDKLVDLLKHRRNVQSQDMTKNAQMELKRAAAMKKLAGLSI